MGKMKELLEMRLDEYKWELYYVLKRIVEGEDITSWDEAHTLIAKIEELDKNVES